MAEILGINDLEMQRVTLWDFLASPLEQTVARNYLADLQRGDRMPRDLQLTRRDRTTLWVLTNGSPIFDAIGQHTGTLCMLTDVTSRKQFEEELKLAKQTAEVANQAKSEFLANMSHELRTPLNGILGYAQILKHDRSLNSRQVRDIGIIQQSGNHLLTLINDILDLAKIEARKLDLYPTEIDLRNCLESVVGIIQMRAREKDLRFIHHAAANLPLGIQADEKRLRQILLNLLSNAVKFTDQGEVSLRVTILEQEPETIGLRFAVTDTGVGISPSQQEIIFQPFEQVGDQKRRDEGTGLGLSITRQLVEKMGGTLQVDSVLGQGSTFWFDVTFPVTVSDIQGARPTTDLGEIIGYQGPTRKLLLVDDKLENRLVLQNLLEPLGFELVLGENGQEEIDLAQSTSPDLILTDLVMPVKSGFEAIQEIRQLPDLHHIPVIAISASVLETNRQKSQIYGCDDFLPKPIEEQQLLALLKRYLDLQWIYQVIAPPATAQVETNMPTQMSIPPSEDLEQLLEWAKMGWVMPIQQWAEQELGGAYPVIASQLYQLTQGFQIEEIQRMLQQWLEGEKKPGATDVPCAEPRFRNNG